MYPVHHLLNRTTARGLGFIALLFMLAFKVEGEASSTFKVEEEASKKGLLLKIWLMNKTKNLGLSLSSCYIAHFQSIGKSQYFP